MQQTPQQRYRLLIEKHTATLQQLEKRRARLGWLRLIVFLITGLLSYKVFVAYGFSGFIPVVLGLGALLYLVSQDVVNNTKIANVKTLLKLNQDELNILNHQFYDRDEGSRFLPAEHTYAADLDIFGKASLYQWLNRSYTQQGQTLLANNLLSAQSLNLILLRQAATKELAPLIEWRQQLQAYAMQTKLTTQTEERIVSWAQEEEKHFLHPGWKIFIFAYSFFSLSTGVAALLGFIPATLFSALFI